MECTPVILTVIPLSGWHPGRQLAVDRTPLTKSSTEGFIALVGIVVRHLILAIDFIRHGGGAGRLFTVLIILARFTIIAPSPQPPSSK